MAGPEAPRAINENPKYEISHVFHGTFADLGIQGPRLRNVGLEHMPTQFVRLKDGKDTIHLAIMQPLAGEGLNNLLAAISPSKPRYTNLYNTAFDLTLPDKAREGKHYAVTLHGQHETSPRFGSAYQKFDRDNRKDFITALDSAPPDINDLYHAAWHTRFIDPQTFGKTYMREELAEIESELKKERLMGKSLEMAREINISDKILVKNNQLYTLYAQARLFSRDLTFAEFIERDDPKLITTLNKFAIKEAGEHGVTLVDSTSGKISPSQEGYSNLEMSGLRVLCTAPRETNLLETREVEYAKTVNGRRISIKVAPTGDINEPGDAKVVETNIPSDMLPFALTPVIAYRVGDNGRTFLTQPELKGLVIQTNILPLDAHPDVALGTVALANFSPAIVDKMGEHMSLHAHGPLQNLMEGQVAVLYDVFSDKFLSPHNKAIQAIEAIK